MKPRFNKDNVLIHIELRMKQLEEKWGFNPNNGWSQVDGEPIEKIVVAIATEEGFAQIFVRKKQVYLPQLKQTISNYYLTNQVTML